VYLEGGRGGDGGRGERGGGHGERAEVRGGGGARRRRLPELRGEPRVHMRTGCAPHHTTPQALR
jgi:hypothetical protein